MLNVGNWIAIKKSKELELYIEYTIRAVHSIEYYLVIEVN
jgi:hypothetical protein